MKLRDYWNNRAQQDEFSVYGIMDKVLTDKGIRYLLFFESDEKFNDNIKTNRRYFRIVYPFRVFFTRNGFHVVGFGLHSSIEKKDFFHEFQLNYPNSDYFMENATLRPNSMDELEFIVTQAFSENLLTEPIKVKYYRDKKVIENLGF